MSEAPIIFEELPAASGKIGRITLNVAATLNSLTLEMVDLLHGEWSDIEMTLLPLFLSTGLERKPFALEAMCRRCTGPR